VDSAPIAGVRSYEDRVDRSVYADSGGRRRHEAPCYVRLSPQQRWHTMGGALWAQYERTPLPRSVWLAPFGSSSLEGLSVTSELASFSDDEVTRR